MSIDNPDLNERVRSEKEQVREQASDGDTIGWNGQTVKEMLEAAESEYEETGHCFGIDEFELKDDSPIQYEKIFSQLRGLPLKVTASCCRQELSSTSTRQVTRSSG